VVKKQVDPAFSRRAAVVLHSPYWYQDTDSPRTEDIVAHDDRQQAEMRRLSNALIMASNYDDLAPEDRALFDKAEAYLEQWQLDHLDDYDEEEGAS